MASCRWCPAVQRSESRPTCRWPEHRLLSTDRRMRRFPAQHRHRGTRPGRRWDTQPWLSLPATSAEPGNSTCNSGTRRPRPACISAAARTCPRIQSFFQFGAIRDPTVDLCQHTSAQSRRVSRSCAGPPELVSAASAASARRTKPSANCACARAANLIHDTPLDLFRVPGLVCVLDVRPSMRRCRVRVRSLSRSPVRHLWS
jgi:hypothetical protein